MKHNVSSLDRALRVILGLGLIAWGVYAHNWLGALGVIPIFTGIIRFCPAYTLLGLSTCKDRCQK